MKEAAPVSVRGQEIRLHLRRPHRHPRRHDREGQRHLELPALHHLDGRGLPEAGDRPLPNALQWQERARGARRLRGHDILAGGRQMQVHSERLLRALIYGNVDVLPDLEDRVIAPHS